MFMPSPHDRETIPSFGYRVARRSGLASLNELTILLDIDRTALCAGEALSAQRFADYARCDPAFFALSARTVHGRRLQIGPDPRNRVQHVTWGLRVCPLCLAGLPEGDLDRACLGRTEWQVRASHTCLQHQVRLIDVAPEVRPHLLGNLARVADAMSCRARSRREECIDQTPTALETYIGRRVGGTFDTSWIDTLDLSVVTLSAEVFGALREHGAKGGWSRFDATEWRRLGAVGLPLMRAGPEAIKTLLAERIGQGGRGNDFAKALGPVFDIFYMRHKQPHFRPLCQLLADYVDANFLTPTGCKVFGFPVTGQESRSLRSLCIKHDIGYKVTARALELETGTRPGVYSNADPARIAAIAPLLRGLLDAASAARHLVISHDALSQLVRKGAIVPAYRFNGRMVGFRPEDLDAFLAQVLAGAEVTDPAPGLKSILAVARIHNVAAADLLRILKARDVARFAVRGCQGLGALHVQAQDAKPLAVQARAGRRGSGG